MRDPCDVMKCHVSVMGPVSTPAVRKALQPPCRSPLRPSARHCSLLAGLRFRTPRRRRSAPLARIMCPRLRARLPARAMRRGRPPTVDVMFCHEEAVRCHEMSCSPCAGIMFCGRSGHKAPFRTRPLGMSSGSPGLASSAWISPFEPCSFRSPRRRRLPAAGPCFARVLRAPDCAYARPRERGSPGAGRTCPAAFPGGFPPRRERMRPPDAASSRPIWARRSLGQCQARNFYKNKEQDSKSDFVPSRTDRAGARCGPWNRGWRRGRASSPMPSPQRPI